MGSLPCLPRIGGSRFGTVSLMDGGVAMATTPPATPLPPCHPTTMPPCPPAALPLNTTPLTADTPVAMNQPTNLNKNVNPWKQIRCTK